jgi:transposase
MSITLPVECTTLYVGVELSQQTLVCRALDWRRHVRLQLTVPNKPAGVGKLLVHLRGTLRQTPDLTNLMVGMEATNQYWQPVQEEIEQQGADWGLPLQVVILNPRVVHLHKACHQRAQKTDVLDALAIAHYLRDGDLPVQVPVAPRYLALRQLTRYRKRLVDMLVQEKNRCLGFMFRKSSGLRQAPVVTHAFSATNRGLYTAADSLDDLLDWSPETFIEQLNTWSRRHLANPEATAETVRAAIRASYPVPEELVGPLNTCLTTSLTIIDAIARQILGLDTVIEQALLPFPEAALLRSIPGLGRVFTAGLTAEIAGIGRFANHPALAHYTGLLWDRHQSGEFDGTYTRRIQTGNSVLRYYLVEGANSARVHAEEFKAYYLEKRAEHADYAHQRALLFTARKLVRIIFYCLTLERPYLPPSERHQLSAA